MALLLIRTSGHELGLPLTPELDFVVASVAKQLQALYITIAFTVSASDILKYLQSKCLIL